MNPSSSERSASPPILLVTRQEPFARTLDKQLRGHGYQLEWANSGYDGLLRFRETLPSLVLLERTETAVHDLREAARRADVLVIGIQAPGTPCSDDECIEDLQQRSDAVICTESYREIAARIRALLRRERLQATSRCQYDVGPIRMDVARHEVTVNGAVVDLTLREFQILQQLMEVPDKVFTRQDLLNRVWGVGFALEEHTLDVHVYALRQKIEPNPARPIYIRTIRGIGYKLQVAAL